MRSYIRIIIPLIVIIFLFVSAADATRPQDYKLKEGDLISAIFSDDPDVYIINEHGYKRLFLNPEIFSFYGHLGGFLNVKLVTPEVRDAFETSSLFRNCEEDDVKVYGIAVSDEDAGVLHWVDTSGEQAVTDDPDFFKKVFCINEKEFDWYPKGQLLESVNEVPKYTRVEKITICHYPPGDPGNPHTLIISKSALEAHLAHGDTIGPCEEPEPSPTPTPTPPITSCEVNIDCGAESCSQSGNACQEIKNTCQEGNCFSATTEYVGYICTNSRCVNRCGDGFCSSWESRTICPEDCVAPTEPGACVDPDGHLPREERVYVKGEKDGRAVDCCADLPTPDNPRSACNKKIGKQDEGQSLWESFCRDGKSMSFHYICPYGCKDGACIRESEVGPGVSPLKQLCIDSDGGKEYYVKGTVSDENAWSHDDYCMTPVLNDEGQIITTYDTQVESCEAGNTCYINEGICIDEDPSDPWRYWTMAFSHGKCPYGCRDGACIGETGEIIEPAPVSGLPDIVAPANLINFIAIGGNGQVNLSWTNPPDEDFTGVKIVRQTGDYPTRNSGISVYSGAGTSYSDSGLINGTTYYYKAFAYDEVPNYSLGVGTFATPTIPVSPPQFLLKWDSLGSSEGQLRNPRAITTDSSNNVYIIGYYPQVVKFTSDGVFITEWGSRGSDDGQFGNPFDIAVDTDDNVYVVDHQNHRIQKFTSVGTFITKWGSQGAGDGQFFSPSNIAVDTSNNVYVADNGNYRIQKFTSDGVFITEWGSYGTGDEQFYDLSYLATDTNDNVYAVDSNRPRIQKFTSDGVFITRWGSEGSGDYWLELSDGQYHEELDGKFNNPQGIAVDASNNVYVVDTHFNRIQKFTSDGVFITKWGSQGTGDGQFYYPWDIAIDTSGNIYVTESSPNQRIQKFTPSHTAFLGLGQRLASINRLFKDIQSQVVAVFAAALELLPPGLTPDSPFYFLDTITEAIGTFFTFGDLKKAERHMALAAERLAEVNAVAEKGKPELVEKTLERYENQLEKALSRVERAKTKGENTVEVTETISEATQKHIGILEEVLEKVPEQAKSAIEQAMTVSAEGSERAVEAVSSGQSFEVLKAKCLESGAPPNVCESMEQALQSTRPLRTLCLEQGGTQEMCDMFPRENFRSFKQIEDFCLESGGPPEICSSLEGRCRELGITTADQCFRVLSISTVTTFTAAEVRSVPAREIDPDCPRGHVTYGTIKSCCVDSDIGLTSNPIQNHYYTKGTLECKVIDTADGTMISHTIDTDSCEGNKLIERKYDNVHKASFEEYVCPNGCQDGACIGEGTEGSERYRTIRYYTPEGTMIEYLETPEGAIERSRVEPPGEE